ncbi:MAG: hypothetical protein M3R51_06365 [Candidatus Eremiobacteraeota bacterium]|nr:hypothetical protein [Candidatus Eremiobacteraeota bacterium]
MPDRFTVTFEDDAAQVLKDLATKRGSKVDVLRDALGLEREYQEALKRDARMIILEKDGSMTRLVRI